MQVFYTADLDNVGTRAADIRAHRVQEVREVNDMRLFGSVLDDGLTLRLDGGEHDVDGRSDGNGIEINARAVEGLGSVKRDDRAVDQIVFRAHELEALEVLVDRTNAEVTAAGKRDLSLMKTAEQRSEQIVGSAHLADAVLRRLKGMDGTGIDIEGIFVDAANHRAHILQDVGDDADVGDIRYIFNAAGLVAQNNAGDDRHGSVLGAADSDLSEEGLAACNHDFFQNRTLLKEFYRYEDAVDPILGFSIFLHYELRNMLLRYNKDNTKACRCQPKKRFVIKFGDIVCNYKAGMSFFSMLIILLCNYFVIIGCCFSSRKI